MFWDIFKRLCQENSTTPTAVVCELGLSKSSVTYWKQGKVPHAATLTKIANYFNVPVAKLITQNLEAKSTIGSLSEEQEKLVSELIKTLPNNQEKTLSPEKINLLKKVVMLEDNEVSDISTVLDILLAKKDEKK